jgi:hypothetical protein
MSVSAAIAAEHVVWARAAGLTPTECVAVISPRLRADNWGVAHLLLEAAHDHLVARLRARVHRARRDALDDRMSRQALAVALTRRNGATLAGRPCR